MEVTMNKEILKNAIIQGDVGTQGAYYLNRQVVHDRTKSSSGADEVNVYYEIHGQRELSSAENLEMIIWLFDPAGYFASIMKALLKEFDPNKFEEIHDVGEKIAEYSGIGRWEFAMKVSRSIGKLPIAPVHWLDARIRVPLSEVPYLNDRPAVDKLMYDLLSTDPNTLKNAKDAIKRYVYKNPNYPHVSFFFQ